MANQVNPVVFGITSYKSPFDHKTYYSVRHTDIMAFEIIYEKDCVKRLKELLVKKFSSIIFIDSKNGIDLFRFTEESDEAHFLLWSHEGISLEKEDEKDC